MAMIAERAFTSRATMHRLERGDPGVSMGIYASVMHALGLIDQLADVADPSRDEVGLARADETLPKRARPKRTQRSADVDDE
jgi:hypothetical protein